MSDDKQKPSPTGRPPKRPSNDRKAGDRGAGERASDHEAIDRLADDLVPALIAKLAASGLAEIEVGEGSWSVRVRRPGDGSTGHNRRASDRASRSQPGHAGHGHAPAGFEGHRSSRDPRPAPAAGSVASVASASSNGSGPVSAEAIGGTTRRPGGTADPYRIVATSPAVGVFQPRPEAKSGTRVRSGDRLGAVDMLGVPQEVVAPADGIVGASLVEAGQAVEYGQELVVIELTGRPADRSEA